MTSQFDRIDDDGFAFIPGMLPDDACDELTERLIAVDAAGAGTCRLLAEPWCTALAHDLKRHTQLGSVLPRDAVATHCTLFGKSPQKNWLVSAHQDLSIPVRERVPTAECLGWSQKEGDVFVFAPDIP